MYTRCGRARHDAPDPSEIRPVRRRRSWAGAGSTAQRSAYAAKRLAVRQQGDCRGTRGRRRARLPAPPGRSGLRGAKRRRIVPPSLAGREGMTGIPVFFGTHDSRSKLLNSREPRAREPRTTVTGDSRRGHHRPEDPRRKRVPRRRSRICPRRSHGRSIGSRSPPDRVVARPRAGRGRGRRVRVEIRGGGDLAARVHSRPGRGRQLRPHDGHRGIVAVGGDDGQPRPV